MPSTLPKSGPTIHCKRTLPATTCSGHRGPPIRERPVAPRWALRMDLLFASTGVEEQGDRPFHRRSERHGGLLPGMPEGPRRDRVAAALATFQERTKDTRLLANFVLHSGTHSRWAGVHRGQTCRVADRSALTVIMTAVSPGRCHICDQRRVESAIGVLRGDQQGCAVLRSRPRECCQEAGNEGGRPHEPALGPIRPAGPKRRRRVIGEDEHRPVSVFPRPRRRTRIPAQNPTQNAGR